MAQQTHLSQRAAAFAEALFGFLDGLRDKGYGVGPNELILVNGMLLKLASERSFPDDLRRLGRLIAPIVCTTPEEQDSFHEYYSKWVHEFEEPQGEHLVSPSIGETSQDSLQRLRRKYGWAVILPVILITLGMAAFVWTSHFSESEVKSDSGESSSKSDSAETKTEHHKTSPVKTESKSTESPNSAVAKTDEGETPKQDAPDSSAVSPNPPVARPGQPEDDAIWPHFIPLAVWCVVAGGFLVWLWQRLRRWNAAVFLERKLGTTASEITEVHLPTQPATAFASIRLSTLARDFRRRERIGVDRLDVNATIKASIQKGGFFTPVKGTRLRVPEYLVLIDREDAGDHLAAIIGEAIHRLRDAEVFLRVYYFGEDPRLCYPARDESARPSSLGELAERYPQHRLLIFGSAKCLANRYDGEIAAWSSGLDVWTHRAVMSPDAVSDWGYVEWQLAHRGFQVMPLSHDGLQAFISNVQSNKHARELPAIDAPPLPPLVLDDTYDWLDDEPPYERIVLRLVRQLKIYLGNDGFRWLVAAAVYPEIHWKLTVHLGVELGIFSDQTLLKIARLPWFRSVTMPNWLRAVLIQTLPNEELEPIRRVLDELLMQSAFSRASKNKLDIEIARETSSTLADASSQLLRRSDLGEDSVLRDRVFARVVHGPSPASALYELPQRFRQRLEDMRSLSPRNYRRVIAVCITPILLVCAIGGALLVWKSEPGAEPPHSPVVPTPEEIAQLVTKSISDEESDLRTSARFDGRDLPYLSRLYADFVKETSDRDAPHVVLAKSKELREDRSAFIRDIIGDRTVIPGTRNIIYGSFDAETAWNRIFRTVDAEVAKVEAARNVEQIRATHDAIRNVLIAPLDLPPKETLEDASEENSKKVSETRKKADLMVYVESLPNGKFEDPAGILDRAMTQWSRAADVRILRTSTRQEAHVVVKASAEVSPQLADASPGPPRGSLQYIRFNPSYAWTKETFLGVSLRQFGSVLGLRHTTKPGQVMSKMKVEDVGRIPQQLQEDDITRIREIWGPPSATSK